MIRLIDRNTLTLRLYRLHWRVRRSRRPQIRQDCDPTQWPVWFIHVCPIDLWLILPQYQQDRCHLSALQCPNRRLREMGCQASTVSSVRLYRPHNLVWYHGPRRSQEKTRCWKDHRVLLLGIVQAGKSYGCSGSPYEEGVPHWTRLESADETHQHVNS